MIEFNLSFSDNRAFLFKIDEMATPERVEYPGPFYQVSMIPVMQFSLSHGTVGLK